MSLFSPLSALRLLLLLMAVGLLHSPGHAWGQGSLSSLLSRLEKHHPLLVMARQKLAGLRKIAKVSGAWPNLQLTYQREQLFPPVGQDTVGVQLKIPLGGRTFRRKDIAKTMSELQREYIVLLSFQVRQRFLKEYFRWLLLRRKNELAQKLLAQFRRLRVILSARVSGGRVAAMELMRFDLELEQQRHRIRRNQGQALVILQKLSRWTQLQGRSLQRVKVTLLPTASKPTNVGVHPLLRYLKARLVVQKAQVRWAQAKAWPDLSLSLAYLHQQAAAAGQPDGHGFVVGATLPLPLWQRNQAEIRRRQVSLSLLQRRVEQARRRLLFQAKQARLRLRKARTRLSQYQKKILKNLPKLLKTAQLAFRDGASFATFLSTYRSLEQYQQFGLTLTHEVRLRALDLEKALGHVSTP